MAGREDVFPPQGNAGPVLQQEGEGLEGDLFSLGMGGAAHGKMQGWRPLTRLPDIRSQLQQCLDCPRVPCRILS